VGFSTKAYLDIYQEYEFLGRHEERFRYCPANP
jgi:hypothetical protein